MFDTTLPEAAPSEQDAGSDLRDQDVADTGPLQDVDAELDATATDVSELLEDVPTDVSVDAGDVATDMSDGELGRDGDPDVADCVCPPAFPNRCEDGCPGGVSPCCSAHPSCPSLGGFFSCEVPP